MNFSYRWLGCLAILGLFLAVRPAATWAQVAPRVVELRVGETQRVEMSKQQDIVGVFNPDPKVCLVQPSDDPKSVLIKGLSQGTSMLSFTDKNKTKETVEVKVIEHTPRVQQVELEVIVALVNRSEVRQLSFNWVENRNNYFVASLLGASNALPLSLATGITPGITSSSQTAAGNPNMQFGVVGNRGAFLGFLEALRTEGLAKVLSEPHVVALSGKKADILSGGETPVVIATSVGSPPTVEYKKFGTSVEFTPLVMSNGAIQLDVFAELSNRNDANGINLPGVTAPGFDSRHARSVVVIEDGQTLAIGGLIQNTVTSQIKKVPVLGDIPFLGTAFSSTSMKENEEELIILVTPRLVHPIDCTQLPRRLPGRETRTADDFELFLTQIMEAPRGQREVCPDHRFRAAHRNGPTADIYPCGDNSQSCGWNRGCATGRCGPGCATGNCGSGHLAAQPALGGISAATGNLTPLAGTESIPITAPNAIPESPASLPIPEVPSLPPLSSPAPLPDARPTLGGISGR